MLSYDRTTQGGTVARGLIQARIRTMSGRMATPAMGTRLPCAPAQCGALDKRVWRTVAFTATSDITEAAMRHLRKLWNTLTTRKALCRCGCGRVAQPMHDASGQPMMFLLASPCAERLFPGSDSGAYFALRTLCG